MMIDEKVCPEHSGVVANIKAIEKCNSKQRKDIETMRTKIDGIMSRLNIILGGIIVSIIMLLLDIIFKID